MPRKEQERPSISVEEFLAVFPDDVARTCRALRSVVQEVVPDATEAVHPGWRLIGYRRGHYFGFIAPQSDHVRFGFEHGADLPDPESRLEGGGSPVRYLRVRSASEVPSDYLRFLLRLAAAPRSTGGGKSAR